MSSGKIAVRGRVSKRGGKVNDKTVHFAFQNKADVEADIALVLADFRKTRPTLVLLRPILGNRG